MNKRQLDIWAIYRDPEHVLDALKIILAKKEDIKEPLTLFVNCVSKFKYNGKEIERHFDTLIYSFEADIVLMVASALYTDQQMGTISAEPRDIAKFLNDNGIPYQIVTGEPSADLDDKNIPEIWFAREEFVLRDGLEESVNNHTHSIDFTPDDNIDLSIGYYVNGEYYEVWGVKGKGVVKTDNNWIIIIDENFARNMTSEDVMKIVRESRNRLK